MFDVSCMLWGIFQNENFASANVKAEKIIKILDIFHFGWCLLCID